MFGYTIPGAAGALLKFMLFLPQPWVLGLEMASLHPELVLWAHGNGLVSLTSVSACCEHRGTTSLWDLALSSSSHLPRSRKAGTRDCSVFIFFSESLYSFPWWLPNWTVLPPIPNGSSFCISLTTLAVICVSLYTSHPNCGGVVFHCRFELPFPNIIKHLILGLYNNIFPFEKCLFARC